MPPLAGLNFIRRISEHLGSAQQRQEGGINSATVWFVVLVALCMAGPYLLGVRPKTPREWVYVAITIALLAWLLPLMASVLSRVD